MYVLAYGRRNENMCIMCLYRHISTNIYIYIYWGGVYWHTYICFYTFYMGENSKHETLSFIKDGAFFFLWAQYYFTFQFYFFYFHYVFLEFIPLFLFSVAILFGWCFSVKHWAYMYYFRNMKINYIF